MPPEVPPGRFVGRCGARSVGDEGPNGTIGTHGNADRQLRVPRSIERFELIGVDVCFGARAAAERPANWLVWGLSSLSPSHLVHRRATAEIFQSRPRSSPRAYVLLEFVLLVVFFITLVSATRSLNRLIIGGIRKILTK